MTKNAQFQLNEQLLQDFPDIHLAVLKADLPAQEELSQSIAAMTEQLNSAIAGLDSFDPITMMPELAVWRTAYQNLGVKPSKFPSSIEALLRRAKKGEHASIGIPAVDLYNTVSVVHRVPMGAYDMAKLGDDPIELRYASPEDDVFSPLGGRTGGFPLNPKLAVYAQGNEILCWGFNTRDSAKTAVDDASRAVLFLSESVSSDFRERSVTALEELSNVVEKAGGSAQPIATISASQPCGTV